MVKTTLATDSNGLICGQLDEFSVPGWRLLAGALLCAWARPSPRRQPGSCGRRRCRGAADHGVCLSGGGYGLPPFAGEAGAGLDPLLLSHCFHAQPFTLGVWLSHHTRHLAGLLPSAVITELTATPACASMAAVGANCGQPGVMGQKGPTWKLFVYALAAVKRMCACFEQPAEPV